MRKVHTVAAAAALIGSILAAGSPSFAAAVPSAGHDGPSELARPNGRHAGGTAKAASGHSRRSLRLGAVHPTS